MSPTLCIRPNCNEQDSFNHLAFWLKTPERANIIKAVWLGNLELTKELLTRDPNLIDTKFDGKIKNSTKDISYDIKRGTLLHLACFIAHDEIVKLLISSKPQLVNYSILPGIGISANTTTFGTPLNIVVNHLSDRLAHCLVFRLLEACEATPSLSLGIPKIKEQLPILTFAAASKGKKLMLESMFQFECRSETQELHSFLGMQYNFPKDLCRLITSYSSYIMNPAIQDLCKNPVQFKDSSNTIQFSTPLHATIRSLTFQPSQELVETAQFFLNNGAYFDNFKQVGKQHAKNRFSMCEAYKNNFPVGYPVGYLDKLLSNQNSEILTDELIRFQTAKLNKVTQKEKCLIM